MNKELEIWQFAAERLKRGETLTLLAVAESEGSSPGREGFKMIVAADDLCGSVGGGVMEVALVEEARKLIADSGIGISDSESQIANRKSQIFDRVHRKNAENSSGMICSGKQTVIVFRLAADDLRTVEKIAADVRNNRERYLQITPEKLAVTAKKIPAFDFKFERGGDDRFLYEEKLGFKQRLFIVGGGHCAFALSEIMSRLDFRISLFDDRADLNTLAKNRFAHEKKIIESYEKIDRYIPAGSDVYVVVMTLGYRFDEIVIRRLIDKDFKYFGVLGSRAKMKTLLKTLEKEGFAKERLARLRTPVGLPIRSRTPEEIAVSIAAEIIAVKNEPRAGHERTRKKAGN